MSSIVLVLRATIVNRIGYGLIKSSLGLQSHLGNKRATNIGRITGVTSAAK